MLVLCAASVLVSQGMNDFDSRDTGRGQDRQHEDYSDLFADADLVFIYTRAEAIADGILIDVSEMAGQAGFRYPVALTAALWSDIHAISEEYVGFEDVPGRLWDVLFTARMAAQQSTERDSSSFMYSLVLHTGGNEEYTVKLVCGPGDNLEPVITLMQPNED